MRSIRAGREHVGSDGEVLGEVRAGLRQLLEGEARPDRRVASVAGATEAGVAAGATDEMARSSVSRVAELARTFDSPDWTELRVTGQSARRQATPFKDAFETASLPPAMLEYLRLLLISDLAQSPQLREEYLRQARALAPTDGGARAGQVRRGA